MAKRKKRRASTRGTKNEKRRAPQVSPWTQFWHGTESPHRQALFRILFGLFLFGYIVRYWEHVTLMFSSEGVYVPVIVRDVAPPPVVAIALFLAFILSIVLFIAGCFTRFITPVVFALFGYHWLLNLAIKNTAYDRLIGVILFVCIFATLDGAWSVRSRLHPDRTAALRIQRWPAQLLKVQLALLYFGAGLWKLLATDWHTGEMLRMTLAGPWATPAAFWLLGLGLPSWIFGVMTWSTIFFELTAPFALFIPRVRVIFMLIGASFHIGIWVFLGINEFLFCVTIYVLFFDPETLQKSVEAWKRRFGHLIGLGLAR